MPKTHDLEALKIDRKEPPRRGGLWILISCLVIAIGVVTVFALRWERPVPVRVASVTDTVTEGRTTVLNASGYVTARRKATVSSKVTGKVVEILIEEGMRVDRGQVLARLDDSNARLALELDEARLAANVADLEEIRVRIREARLDLDRIQNLVDQKVASVADLDRAAAEVDSLEARLASQSERVDVARREIAVQRQYLEDLVIRAPFAGVIVSKDAQPGEMISPVSAGGGYTRTGIGTVVDMDSLEIEVDVNESYINRVEAGQPVEATLDAYTDWKIPARVIAIIPTADRQKATVQVRIAFDQLDPRILPDMGVKVAFQDSVDDSPEQRSVVVVPEEAVRSDDGAKIVFVLSGNTVERRAVKLGEAVRQGQEVIAGLQAGERVVLDPPDELVDGAKVEVAQ